MLNGKTTHLKIITPNGTVFDGPVQIVNVKTISGEWGILPEISPIVAALSINVMHLTTDKGEVRKAAVSGGVIYAEQKSVLIITDAIEFEEKIDLDRALLAKQTVEARLKEAHDKEEEAALQLALRRAINRINLKKG